MGILSPGQTETHKNLSTALVNRAPAHNTVDFDETLEEDAPEVRNTRDKSEKYILQDLRNAFQESEKYSLQKERNTTLNSAMRVLRRQLKGRCN